MKHLIFGIVYCSLSFLASNTFARTDTIYFGGSGTSSTYTFSPSSLNVTVGDTILWLGAFSGPPMPHTATSFTVPSGAQAFNFTSGTSATYIVTVAGPYAYRCSYHYQLGMTGTFTASEAGVPSVDQGVTMDPVYPNPAMAEAMVHFTLDKPAHVTLRIYNSTGALIQTPTDENMNGGFHMLMIDTKSFTSGSYQYVLQAGDAVLRRDAIVVK